jgi:hypothetical protein
MGNPIITGLAGKVLPKDGVRRCPHGIELLMKNPLPKVTIRDFKIDKIPQYADIYINEMLLTREHFQRISAVINEQQFTLEQLEAINELEIPHKPHSKIILPPEFGATDQISFRMLVKLKKPLQFDLVREIQA